MNHDTAISSFDAETQCNIVMLLHYCILWVEIFMCNALQIRVCPFAS